MKSPMSSKPIQPNAASRAVDPDLPFFREELPLNVRQAAIYLGVSVQTVYLWVERKQIPELRVMGGNIRFLKIGGGAIPRAVQTEMENARPSKHDGVLYKRSGSEIWWMRYRDRDAELQAPLVS